MLFLCIIYVQTYTDFMIEWGRIQSFYLIVNWNLEVLVAHFIDLFIFYDAFNGFSYSFGWLPITIAKNNFKFITLKRHQYIGYLVNDTELTCVTLWNISFYYQLYHLIMSTISTKSRKTIILFTAHNSITYYYGSHLKK